MNQETDRPFTIGWWRGGFLYRYVCETRDVLYRGSLSAEQGREAPRTRNLNCRTGYCRSPYSFRLMTAGRFALRASAHRAHTSLRHPAVTHFRKE